jgi:hypothetical protein
LNWQSSPLVGFSFKHYKSKKYRKPQYVYHNAADPVSMTFRFMEKESNVKMRSVDVKSTSAKTLSSPHALSNYYLNGYDGDVSQGVRVQRGGNVQKMLEPFIQRAAGTSVLRNVKGGTGIAVALTVNDTYHALKKIDADENLSRSQKRVKKALKTTESIADFAVSSSVGLSAEAAAAGMLTAMGATGAIAVGAPLLMGTAAALVTSQAIRWLGGKVQRYAMSRQG